MIVYDVSMQFRSVHKKHVGVKRSITRLQLLQSLLITSSPPTQPCNMDFLALYTHKHFLLSETICNIYMNENFGIMRMHGLQ